MLVLTPECGWLSVRKVVVAGGKALRSVDGTWDMDAPRGNYASGRADVPVDFADA